MKRLQLAAGALLCAVHLGIGAAEVAYLTEPSRKISARASSAGDARAYRIDAARHIYASYASRIYKGRLPPLIHGVVVVETTVDTSGHPRSVKLVRGPSHAPDVSAAVIEMIKLAGPLPLLDVPKDRPWVTARPTQPCPRRTTSERFCAGVVVAIRRPI